MAWVKSRKAREILGLTKDGLRGRRRRGSIKSRETDVGYESWVGADIDEDHGADDDKEDTVDGSGLLLESDSYLYNSDTDTFITFIKAAPKPVVMSGDDHRGIVAAYSNWDGSPSTVNEICRQFGMPRNWLVQYLRAHDVTHDREPFTREQVLESDPDALAEEALEMARYELHKKFTTKKWKREKEAARNWHHFEHTVLARLEEKIAKQAQRKKPQRPKSKTPPFVVVTCATDFHYGSRAWVGESGNDGRYDIATATRRLEDATEDLMSRIPQGAEKIICPVGSDWFHVDGQTATTTSGTPQDVDATPTEILVGGIDLACEHVQHLRDFADVDVVQMAGNHDRTNGFSLLLYLDAFFKNDPSVVVTREFAPRVYRRFGETLMCFSHGDGEKVKDLGAIMACEARKDWGKTLHHIAFGGHLHHQRVTETGGITHYLMPSLAGSDRWHKRNGYVTSTPGMAAYVICKERGLVASYFSPAD